MFEKVAFTMYPVKDWERARAFYGDTLGLKMGMAAPNGMWTEYDLPGGGCLALYATEELTPSANGASVAIEVADLDALIPQLRDKGVEFKGEMIHSPVCRMSIIVDSEGNSLILHELKSKKS